MKYLFLVLIFLYSCGHLKDDITTGYAENNYMSVYFQFQQGNYFGILPINLQEDAPLPRDVVVIKLFWKGTIHLFSRACNINKSDRFDGDYLFKLENLDNCTISITVMPDPIKKLQHEIVEIGEIVTYVRKADEWSLLINNSLTQATMQRVTNNPFGSIPIKTYSNSGLMIVTSTCNISFQEEYNADIYTLYMRKLSTSESCDYFFRAIPYDEPKTRVGKLTVNLYNERLVPLDSVTPTFSKGRLKISIPVYIIATQINKESYFVKNIDIPYYDRTFYTITWITKTGRKNISIYYGDKLFWQP